VKILDTIIRQYNQKLPFVVYNKPNGATLVGLFQNNDKLYTTSNFTEVGFVFAPFNAENSVLIPENESEIYIENINFENIVIPNEIINEVDEFEENRHINLVKKGIEAVKAGCFEKVVLSRKEVIEMEHFDLVLTIKNIINQYPQAFTYCFFHPAAGLWLGAFSEQLIKIDENKFSTASIAGTQRVNGSEPVSWQNKEIKEQQIVTDFIVSKLENQVFELEISEPQTIYSGNLTHIKTEISGKFNNDITLNEVVQILHPTPAVCGFPTQIAKEFILANEGYNRGYYAGFLGELNKDFQNNGLQTDLFVNLRCMKIENNQATFFAGGGIIKDSEPEKEWQETVNKISAMKNCLA
jgi:isochorismate synthase